MYKNYKALASNRALITQSILRGILLLSVLDQQVGTNCGFPLSIKLLGQPKEILKICNLI